MNLDIKKILPVPDKKMNISEDDWNKVEKIMNFKFPKDYKEFISTYGACAINEFFVIFSPFCKDKDVNLLDQFKRLEDAYNSTKNKFPEYFKLDFFNGKQGLFPFGHTYNGDELYWNILEEETRITVFETRSDEYVEYSMTMTEFLYKVLAGKLICSAFPDNLLDNSDNLIEQNNYYISYN